MSVKAFEQAQQETLDIYGIDAEIRSIESPACNGRAQVLVVGDGPPVVVVNGIGTPAAMFAPLIAQLDGFKLHAIDLPGFGLTDAPPAFTDDLRANAVRFLEESLDYLELDRPAIIANSLGALWTSWLALDRPDRVAGLVHIGCPALLLDTSAPLPMRLLSIPPLGRLMMRLQPPSPKQVEGLSKMVGQHPLPPDIAHLILATEQLPESNVFFRSMLNTLVRPRGSRPDKRLTPEQLGQISQPLLYIWGSRDPFGSVETGRRAASIVPNAEFHVIDGGHTPWLQSPEEAGALVDDFLNRLDLDS